MSAAQLLFNTFSSSNPMSYAIWSVGMLGSLTGQAWSMLLGGRRGLPDVADVARRAAPLSPMLEPKLLVNGWLIASLPCSLTLSGIFATVLFNTLVRDQPLKPPHPPLWTLAG